MKGAGLRRMTIVVVVCALAGALAGIAGSAAAPSKSKKAVATAKAKAMRKQAHRFGLMRAFRHGAPGPGGFLGGPGGFMGGPGGPGGMLVHATAVVPNPAGTGFDTITTDGGILNSVDGTTVHLKEGTDKATYKDDVAIDVGSDAKVVRDRAAAKLSDLQPGDHVRVVQAPRGNVVIAVDDAFIAKEKKEHQGWHRFPGPPPPGAPAPPAGAGAPAPPTNG